MSSAFIKVIKFLCYYSINALKTVNLTKLENELSRHVPILNACASWHMWTDPSDQVKEQVPFDGSSNSSQG